MYPDTSLRPQVVNQDARGVSGCQTLALKASGPIWRSEAAQRCITRRRAAFAFFTQAKMSEKDLPPGPQRAQVGPRKKASPLGGHLQNDAPLVVRTAHAGPQPPASVSASSFVKCSFQPRGSLPFSGYILLNHRVGEYFKTILSYLYSFDLG